MLQDDQINRMMKNISSKFSITFLNRIKTENLYELMEKKVINIERKFSLLFMNSYLSYRTSNVFGGQC